MSRKLNVGLASYLNTLPLFCGLKANNSVNLVTAVPSQLNEMLRCGEIDIGLVSSWAYLCSQDEWELVPGLCIAAEGRAMSVNFYHRYPISQLNGQPVALTSHSASAARLLQVLCQTFWQIQPLFVELPALEQATNYPGFLLIGDEALTHRHFTGYETCDLAAAWYEKTVLPVTFAVLAVRRQILETRGDEIAELAIQLERSLRWAESHRDELVIMATSRSHLDPALVREYFSVLRYRLGPAEWNGLRAFATLCQCPRLLAAEVPAW